MTDHYKSRASTHAADCWSWGPAHYECAVGEIKALRADLMESEEIREKMGHLLTCTAAALKGEPPEGTWHSWHDLPEKVTQLTAALRKLEKRVQRDESLASVHSDMSSHVDMDEYRAMVAAMERIDPATLPGLTAEQRCALSRFAKPAGGLAGNAQPERRPYNASGSLSEYGIFPECDAAQAEAEPRLFLTEEDDAWCAECGVKLETLRPGKHQHPTCSQAQPLTDEALLRQALDALAYWLEHGETPGSHDIIQRTHEVLRKRLK